jgi:hypothetical protein
MEKKGRISFIFFMFPVARLGAHRYAEPFLQSRPLSLDHVGRAVSRWRRPTKMDKQQVLAQ